MVGASGARFVLACLVVAVATTLGLAVPSAVAQSTPPSPSPSASASPRLDHRIRLSAEPLLAGAVRARRWAAIRVRVENDGPLVDGELRVTTLDKDAATHAIAVQLPAGARQEHVIHARAGALAGRFRIRLDDATGTTVAVDDVVAGVIGRDELGVAIVAEHPDRMIEAIRATFERARSSDVSVGSMELVDLPSRVQAWAPVDVIVWQDVPAHALTSEQVQALRAWIGLGGHLVVLGGSMGIAGLEGLPVDVLPFVPDRRIDVPQEHAADVLADVLPGMDQGSPAMSVMAGPPGAGLVQATSDGLAIVARRTVGLGGTVLSGLDPTSPDLPWTVASALWARLLPVDAHPVGGDGSSGRRSLSVALDTLPTLSVPRQDQVLLLFVAYLLLLGPINYLVLRRLDRLAWAWITMPVLIGIFAITVVLIGVVLKGSSVVARELAIVRTAAGLDQGAAEVQVSVFAPYRSTFDVGVSGGVLITVPATRRGREAESLDVVGSDPGRVRGLRLEPGVQRGFRVEMSLPAPRVEADLRVQEGRLRGRVINASGIPLEGVAVLHGTGFVLLGELLPDQAKEVDLKSTGGRRTQATAKRLLAGMTATDPESRARMSARAALLSRSLPRNGSDQPLIVAWRSGVTVPVDVGVPARLTGDTLFLITAPARLVGPVIFTGATLRPTVVTVAAAVGQLGPRGYSLGQGSMVVAIRPTKLDGGFVARALRVRLAPTRLAPGRDLVLLHPLPEAAQPDPDDALSGGPQPTPAAEDVPRLPAVQLFDRVDRAWVEFEPMDRTISYEVAEPDRYVDASGAILVRFVMRDDGEPVTFGFEARVEGVAT